MVPREIPRLDEVRIDPSILLFGLGISVVTGVLFGVAPALRASRADLSEAIKQSGEPGFPVRPFETPQPACDHPNRPGVRIGHRNRPTVERSVHSH